MIFLEVLKVIGIILLVLLAVVLVFLILILFVPIRYQCFFELKELHPDDEGNISMMQELSYVYGKAKLSWLCSIVSLQAILKNNQPCTFYKIFFLKRNISLKHGGKKNEKTSQKEKDLSSKASKSSKEDQKSEEVKEAKATKEISKGVEEKQKDNQKNNQEVSSKKGFKEKIEAFSNNFSLEDLKAAFKVFFDEFKILISKYKPHTIKGDLTFSMEDPSHIGLSLAVVSVFPNLYCKEFHIHPDFVTEKFYVMGDCVIKGKIRILPLVIFAFRLFRNKEIQKVKASYDHYKKKNKQHSNKKKS